MFSWTVTLIPGHFILNKNILFTGNILSIRESLSCTFVPNFSCFVMSPLLRGGGHTVFGADPVSIGVGISVDITLFCLHNIVNQCLDS